MARRVLGLSFFSPLSPCSLKTCQLAEFTCFRPCVALFSECQSELQSGEETSAKEDLFILTTPLYYVNAPPHMGSAYATIAADAIARFQMLLGKRVVLVTGTDEHGEKTSTTAATNGCSPREHCDNISQTYLTLWKDLDVAYDKFIRTTDPKHERVVEEFYAKVHNNGHIYQAKYEGLYCVNCEEYKDEKELLENNCCPMHLKPCLPWKEDNYFALSKFHKFLEEFLHRTLILFNLLFMQTRARQIESGQKL